VKPAKRDLRPIKRYAAVAALVGAFALLVAGLLPLAFPSFHSRAPISTPVTAASSDVIFVSEPIQLSSTPSIALLSGRLVAGPRSAVGSRMLILESARFEVDLSSTSGRASDDGKSGSDATRNIALTQSLYPQLAALGFDRVRILSSSALIRWNGHEGVEITDLNLDLTPRRTGPVTSSGRFVFAGEDVEISVAVGHWAAVNFEPRKIGERIGLGTRPADAFGPFTKVTMKSGKSSLSFDGQMVFASTTTAAVGELHVTATDPLKVLRAFGFAGPSVQKIDPVAFSGSIVWRDRHITSDDATLRVGDQSATGAVVLSVREDRPMIEGTMSLARLDLAPYIGSLKSTASGGSAPQPWAATAMHFPLASLVDADVRLSAHQLFAGESLIGKGSATLAIRKGRVNANIAELELQALKGTVQLDADMTGSSPTYSIRSRFETTDTAWLARALSLDARIIGRTTGTVELAGTGDTLGALLDGARGRLSLKSNEAVTIPLNTGMLRSVARSTSEMGSKEWKTLLTGTRVEELDVRCQVQGDRIMIERAAVLDKGMRTSLTGSIDRETRVIDAQIVTAPALPASKSATRSQRPGAEPDRVSLAVRGTLDFPRLEPPPAAPQP